MYKNIYFVAHVLFNIRSKNKVRIYSFSLWYDDCAKLSNNHVVSTKYEYTRHESFVVRFLIIFHFKDTKKSNCKMNIFKFCMTSGTCDCCIGIHSHPIQMRFAYGRWNLCQSWLNAYSVRWTMFLSAFRRQNVVKGSEHSGWKNDERKVDDGGIRRGAERVDTARRSVWNEDGSRLAPGCSLRSSKGHNKLERFALITPVGQGPNGYRDRLAWILNSRSGEPQSVFKSVTRGESWTRERRLHVAITMPMLEES